MKENCSNIVKSPGNKEEIQLCNKILNLRQVFEKNHFSVYHFLL